MNETMREVSWRRRILSTSAFFALVATACVNEFTPPGPPSNAYVRILIQATGGDLDDDGYTVYVDGRSSQTLTGGSIESFDVAVGTHEVRLANFAANCSVTGTNPRTVSVGASEIVTVTFAVVCVPTGLAFTVRTTGEDVPNVLHLSVNYVGSTTIASNGSLTFGRLKAGRFVVSLSTPPHCTVAGGATFDVDVTANVLTPVTIEVACTPAVRAEKIAYRSDYYLGEREPAVELVNVDGSPAERIGAGTAPSWSPARNRLVFSTTVCDLDSFYGDPCSGGLALADPETGNVTSVAGGENGFFPSWSPTGDAIAFARPNDATNERELVVLTLASGIATPLVLSGPMSAEQPAWSPDAQRIAFVCRWSFRTDLCIVNADGSGLERVTNDALVEQHPAWSPDGRTIAFSRRPLSPAEYPPSEVAFLDLATRGITRLTDGLDPAWSPDGSRLVFAGGNGLYVIRADGTNLTRLTAGDHHAPTWRP